MPDPQWPVLGGVYRSKFAPTVTKRVTGIEGSRVRFERFVCDTREGIGEVEIGQFRVMHEPDPRYVLQVLCTALRAYLEPAADPVECEARAREALILAEGIHVQR